jgi:AraC family transcriptional regulator
MYRREFPDIATLKQRIAVPGARWPNVVLNVDASDIYRPNIRGGLTIFSNVRGASIVSVDGRSTRVPAGCYLISNRGDEFTLAVERGEIAETMNVHISDEIAERFEHALVSSSSELLEAPEDGPVVDTRFVSRLHRVDPRITAITSAIKRRSSERLLSAIAIEEHVCAITEVLLEIHRDVRREIARLPAVRSATREEVYRRLARAIDCLEAGPGDDLSLEMLAREACLSKFHFLRLFRAAFGETPHQYLLRRRVERAQELLARSALAVSEIGMAVGFDEPSAFSRAFRQRVGVSPAQWRAQSLPSGVL